MTLMDSVQVWQAGDGAVMLEFPSGPIAEVNRWVRAVSRRLQTESLPGVWGIVPALSTILLEYDPLVVSETSLLARLETVPMPDPEPSLGRVIDIPVWYGGEAGPDLSAVAASLHLSDETVIALHTSQPYTIYCIGFAPGFPVAGELPGALQLARRNEPRTAVVPGSVAIAGHQTGIYPQATPGGWHLIGRTPLTLFDWRRDPPCPYSPGDALRFVPIDEAQYQAMQGGNDRDAN